MEYNGNVVATNPARRRSTIRGRISEGMSCEEYGNTGDTKLEGYLPKNQHTQRKLLNFVFWINGELSKIGHQFSNKVI